MQADTSKSFIPGKTRIKYGGAVVDKTEINAINKVLSRNWWTLDAEGREFEKELAQTSEVKHAVFVNSGSSALMLAFSAIELPDESEVIIPAVNFPTAINAVLLNRYKPVFIDVEPQNYCLDLGEVEKAITQKTKAVLCVNIAGSVPDLKKLREITKKHGLFLIIDNCDGYGSKFAGKPVESFADLSCTSFMAAHIITTGEGGALFTNDSNLYKKAVSLREWGRALDSDEGVHDQYKELPPDYQSRYTYITRGFNFRPLELQAAMGRIQLKKLKKIIDDRQNNFNMLHKGLSQFSEYLLLPKVHEEAQISWFSFPITLKNCVFCKDQARKNMLKFLEEKNIETRVIFAGNILKQPAYQNIDHRREGDLKITNNILFNSFFISVHPTVTEEMINYIVSSFKEYFER